MSNSEDSEEEAEPLYLRTTSSLFNGEESVDFEDNWRLQKRKFTSCNSPVPVPMLVPNPTTEAKVFIGDKEAENTSDLSDVASDYEEVEVAPTINSILVDSKTVIGGKNLVVFDGVGSAEDEKGENVVTNGYKDETNGVAQNGQADNGIVLTGEGQCYKLFLFIFSFVVVDFRCGRRFILVFGQQHREGHRVYRKVRYFAKDHSEKPSSQTKVNL